MDITAASMATVGTAMNLECTVSVVPHLITTPHVELFGPEQLLLASANTLSLTHTLDPVMAWNAGQYMCKAVLEIKSVNLYTKFQSAIHPLSVWRKLPIISKIIIDRRQIEYTQWESHWLFIFQVPARLCIYTA